MRIIALRWVGFYVIFLWQTGVWAANFDIVPKGVLPSTVPQFGSSTAFYTVTNLTNSVLSNNVVTNLSETLSQVTCHPEFCGETFNLGPKGSATESCVLKLIVKGPVSPANSFRVCTEGEASCDITATPLNVTQGASLPFIGMGAGLYLNFSEQRFPLVVTTQDSGNHWHYPTEIFSNLTSQIDPNFLSGSLAGAACSGENDKMICIAPGRYANNVSNFPLIAVGHMNATSWNYPHSVFDNLKTSIDPAFTSGELMGGSCSGNGSNSICIAPGNYFDNERQLPLLAKSTNGGTLWTYPVFIHTNLTTSIDPQFTSGFLENASCSKSTCDTVCIATGSYCNDNLCNPLLALSQDKGNTWSYPKAVFQNLPSKLDPNYRGGSLVSSSCTGSGDKTICAAAGTFFNGNMTLPMIALTQNGGGTWTYPTSVFDNLPVRIGHDFTGSIFNDISCTGSGRTTVCIAGGTFFRNGPNLPYIAVTRDAGATWDYPDFIYTKLKVLVDPKFVSGNLNGVSCTGKGKQSICVAAGIYCRDNGCSSANPLIALSTNGGKSWSYPTSVFKDLDQKIDPQFKIGFFRNVNCTGDKDYNFCIAVGQYANNDTTYPLVGISTDSGQTWSYPTEVFQNLGTKINPNFWIGVLNSAGSSGGKFPIIRGKNVYPLNFKHIH